MKNLMKVCTAAACAMTLAACTGSSGSTSASGSYTYADTIQWDAEYDVVVAGFGGAGAVSAMSAADSGASVLITEKEAEGEAGGNTKVCGQLFLNGHGDKDATKQYLSGLADGNDVPDAMLDKYAEGVANISDTIADLFELNKDDFMDWSSIPGVSEMSPEYPELDGHESMTLDTAHEGVSDSYLYQQMKKQVQKRNDNIDVWYESPAESLIQDPDTKTILGVVVERDGKQMNVRADKGVVLATGGFENNADMVENYLGEKNLAIIGSFSNTGDGIKMAQAVGADLWHMDVWEGGFGLGGVTYNVGENEHAVGISTLTDDAMNTGALILVGTQGNRFLNESQVVRHGHLNENGTWLNPDYPDTMYVVMDEQQKVEIDKAGLFPDEYADTIIEADSIKDLAAKLNTPNLETTVSQFNEAAAAGSDPAFHRDGQYMRAFNEGKVYAYPVRGEMLNTQGGPRRNENCEVLDTEGNAIPHLYSAGELGGITSNQYQGGMNIAECIISGQVAGQNAAADKDELPAYTTKASIASTPAKPGEIDDLSASDADTASADTTANEYIGTGTGMGGDFKVKVTMDGDKIAKVEVLDNNETPDVGGKAIEQLPDEIVKANGTDGVDTVSGATVTSKAIFAAVNDALKQAGR